MIRVFLLLLTFSIAASASAADSPLPFQAAPVASFNEPWAMVFLPDGRLLVTEKRGRLLIVTQEGEKSRPVEEAPNADYRGQGGLGDVVLHPDFDQNGLVYISYAESGTGNVRGAAIARGRLVEERNRPRLDDVEVIWRQNPKVSDDGHYGHRMAFDAEGRLWVSEMGPRHGDELNLVLKGRNYGYPIVSEGDHYSGEEIPDHDTRPEFEAPRVAWIPTIAPAGMIFYSGQQFPQWQGSALIAGLASRAIIRVEFEGEEAREAERFDMGARIREIEQGPDGSIWVLEDQDGGRLLKLTPLD